MNVHGKNILYFPYADVSEFQKNPQLSGIPFLAPWANRLDEQAFWANGKKYAFDMDLGNVRGANPIHGLLSSSPYWQVISVTARQTVGPHHQPPGVLAIPGIDGAVALRARIRDDLYAQGRRA